MRTRCEPWGERAPTLGAIETQGERESVTGNVDASSFPCSLRSFPLCLGCTSVCDTRTCRTVGIRVGDIDAIRQGGVLKLT